MSGTNTICVVTALLETGMLPMTEPVTELVARGAGRPHPRHAPTCAGGKVTGVTFRNVPAFATHLDAPVEVPHARHRRRRRRLRRHVLRDRRRGARSGFRLTPDEGRDITRITELIKAAAARAAAGGPPGAAGLRRHHHRAAVRPGRTTRRNACRNVVTVSTGRVDWERPSTWTGAIDRSPCGTGTCAKMAVLHAKGRLRARRGLPPRGDPGHGVHGPARGGDAGRRARPRVVPTITGTALDHRASRATSSTRPTRSPRASRSATSGDRAGGLAQQVAAAERDLGHRRPPPAARPAERHAAGPDVDLDRRGRAVRDQRAARDQAAHAADGHAASAACRAGAQRRRRPAAADTNVSRDLRGRGRDRRPSPRGSGSARRARPSRCPRPAVPRPGTRP